MSQFWWALSAAGVALSAVLLSAASVVKAQRYNRSTEAYLRGDTKRGDELRKVAEDTFRWL